MSVPAQVPTPIRMIHPWIAADKGRGRAGTLLQILGIGPDVGLAGRPPAATSTTLAWPRSIGWVSDS